MYHPNISQYFKICYANKKINISFTFVLFCSKTLPVFTYAICVYIRGCRVSQEHLVKLHLCTGQQSVPVLLQATGTVHTGIN